MIPINRENLRCALITALGIAIVLMALSLMNVLFTGCASQPLPPPTPTVAQLAPEPESTPTAHVTGAMILAQQPPEVQQAIKHGRPWPAFKWPRERLVPYAAHATPLTIDVAPYQDVDLSLEPGEQIDGFALGDDERFIASPLMAQAPHAILKCKIPGIETSGAIYTSTRIYRVHLRCRNKTSLDSISYYYPETVLAQMHAADTAPLPTSQEQDPIAPTVDPSRLNYAYQIDGPANIPWRPTMAFDDGTRVWVQLPNTTSPIAPVISGDNGAVLNSRTRGQYIVVDSLFNRAQLTSGPDRVTITRSGQ
jgi:type IV secretion system protein TrbG